MVVQVFNNLTTIANIENSLVNPNTRIGLIATVTMYSKVTFELKHGILNNWITLYLEDQSGHEDVVVADVFGDQVWSFYHFLRHSIKIYNIVYAPDHINANAESKLIADECTSFEIIESSTPIDWIPNF